MKRVLWVLGALAVSAVAMRVPAAQIVLPGQPHAAFGDSVTPAYEGWFDSPDGRHNIMFGYYNRNSKQEFDIPIGADNNIQPGGPDRGQPTHFLTGRQWGVFLINVPKDFPATTNIIWSLTANGQQIAIPVHMKPDYNIDPFEEAAVHNTPPTIRFDEHGETVQGPLATTFDRTASVGKPLDLPVWATDDDRYTSGSNAPRAKLGDPVRLAWAKYRGPGIVTFTKSHPKFQVLSGGNQSRRPGVRQDLHHGDVRPARGVLAAADCQRFFGNGWSGLRWRRLLLDDGYCQSQRDALIRSGFWRRSRILERTDGTTTRRL